MVVPIYWSEMPVNILIHIADFIFNFFIKIIAQPYERSILIETSTREPVDIVEIQKIFIASHYAVSWSSSQRH